MLKCASDMSSSSCFFITKRKLCIRRHQIRTCAYLPFIFVTLDIAASGPLGTVCVCMCVLMSSVPSGMSLMNVWRKTWFSLLPMLATPSFLFHRRRMIGDRFHPAGLVILVLVWTDRTTDVSSLSVISSTVTEYTQRAHYTWDNCVFFWCVSAALTF